MQVRNGIIEAIGNTPLIKLERVSAATGCAILGKAEFMNPGQSVKDRAALFIIEDAVKKGELRPGGVIVEGTAGNTGIGLALVGNAMGFRSVIVRRASSGRAASSSRAPPAIPASGSLWSATPWASAA